MPDAKDLDFFGGESQGKVPEEDFTAVDEEIVASPPTFLSNQLHQLLGGSRDIESFELGGKLRAAYFDVELTEDAIPGSMIEIVRLPAGKLRVFGKMSVIEGPKCVADVGWTKYRNPFGLITKGDTIGMDEDLEIGPLGGRLFEKLPANSRRFEARDPLPICVTLKTEVSKGETFHGYIIFASN